MAVQHSIENAPVVGVVRPPRLAGGEEGRNARPLRQVRVRAGLLRGLLRLASAITLRQRKALATDPRGCENGSKRRINLAGPDMQHSTVERP